MCTILWLTRPFTSGAGAGGKGAAGLRSFGPADLMVNEFGARDFRMGEGPSGNRPAQPPPAPFPGRRRIAPTRIEPQQDCPRPCF